MNGTSFEFSYTLQLEKTGKNIIFVRCVLTPDGSMVEEFVVSYSVCESDRKIEVVRFDCSVRESLNVHAFYASPPEKRYLNRAKSFETIEELIEMIKKNWQSYLIKFNEK